MGARLDCPGRPLGALSSFEAGCPVNRCERVCTLWADGAALEAGCPVNRCERTYQMLWREVARRVSGPSCGHATIVRGAIGTEGCPVYRYKAAVPG